MPTSPTRPTVLVIDDERLLLRAIHRILGSSYNVLAYEEAGPALAYLTGDKTP